MTDSTDNARGADWEGFGRAIMDEWQEHWDIDASDKFDLAVKFRVLREIEGGFDPEIHDGDADAGDPWYQMNPCADLAAPSPDVLALVRIIHKAKGALGDIFDGEPEWPKKPKKELAWCRNRAREAFLEVNAALARITGTGGKSDG